MRCLSRSSISSERLYASAEKIAAVRDRVAKVWKSIAPDVPFNADFSGTIVYDPKNLAASTVEVTIRDTSIFTANDRRDNHLRTQDFFWVEKYPTITFKSTKVIPGKDDKHFQVVGDLTIRGVTKQVTLDTEFLGMGPASIGGNDLGIQAGFIGTVTIPDRKEYGLVWNKTLDQGGTMLSDDVQLTLNVAAFARNPNAPAPKPPPPPTKG